MPKRRQPTGAFFRRLRAYSEPSLKPEPAVKPDSWIRKFHESDGWLYAEVCVAVAGLIGLLFLIPTGYALMVDLEDRKQQRIAQAWQLVTQKSPGNSGKGPALEYLNSQGIKLVGIDLSAEANGGPAYLQKVNLSDAHLNRANLSGADLYRANLSNAYMFDTNLSGADLHNTNLSGALMYRADFFHANMLGTNLSGARLGGADLSRVIGLIQNQLDAACGDVETKLSRGQTIKYCLE